MNAVPATGVGCSVMVTSEGVVTESDDNSRTLTEMDEGDEGTTNTEDGDGNETGSGSCCVISEAHFTHYTAIFP